MGIEHLPILDAGQCDFMLSQCFLEMFTDKEGANSAEQAVVAVPVALPGAKAPELHDFSEISTKHPGLNRCQSLGTIPSISPLVVLAIASVFGATGQIPEGACRFALLFETYACPFAAYDHKRNT